MKLLALAAACCAFAGERDAAIAAKMREMIAANEVPGAVTVVATRDGVSHLGVIGHAEAGKTRPLRKDSIFWIASMTKPVTAVAVLMMQDEGKLSIDDPVSKYIPEFGANGVTLRHMLTHTLGSQWRYCQSGINMLVRVVEVVSGMPIDQFFAERIFKPLGMKDTTTYLAARRDGEKLVEVPNGGLFSAGPDYARFALMLLRGGELDGKRLLSAASFALITSMQTGSLQAGFRPGHGGAYGTQSGTALIQMVQRVNFRNSDDSPVRMAFQMAARK